MLLQFKILKKPKAKNRILLAADIGATKTHLALFKTENNTILSIAEKKFASADYKNILELTEKFLQQIPAPGAICFGVAGPVINGRAKLSNIAWEIDSKELSRHFKIKKAHLINDLEANAYGLAMLNENDIAIIHAGIEGGGNAAIIAPGTGLGEAGIYWDGKYYHPFATEGGHCDFAPRNAFDFELYTFLQKQFSHVSWERLVCGPGIINIYKFLRDEQKMKEDGWLNEKFKNQDAATIISGNINQSELCKETMQHFIRYLAYESANLALKCKATGGLFIGGGIAPQIVSLFESFSFYSSFCQSGRLNYLLERIPVKIILNPKTALLGAAFYGSNV